MPIYELIYCNERVDLLEVSSKAYAKKRFMELIEVREFDGSGLDE